MTNQLDGSPAPGSPTVLAMPASTAPEGSGPPTETSTTASVQPASPASPTPGVHPTEGTAQVDASTTPTLDRETVASWIQSAPWSEVVAIPRINRAIDREGQRLAESVASEAARRASHDTIRAQVDQLRTSGNYEEALRVQSDLLERAPAPAAATPGAADAVSPAPEEEPAAPPPEGEAAGLSLITSLPTQAARGEMVDVMLRYNSAEDWPIVMAEHARIKTAHGGGDSANPTAPASTAETAAAAQSAAAVVRDSTPAPSAAVGASSPTGRVFTDPGELKTLTSEERRTYFYPNGLPRAGTVLQLPTGYAPPQRGGVIHGGG